MNLKKLGIVLFLLIAVVGFSFSSVSAGETSNDKCTKNVIYIPQD
jgi:hypothetical protein